MALKEEAGNNFTIPRAFKKATSDKQRVMIAYKYMRLDVTQTLDTLGKCKSAEISEQSRLAGNVQYAKKEPHNLHIAILMYTKSIAFAPYPNSSIANSQELAFGFANRSAALFSLGYYAACLEDIAHALAFNYPEGLKYKLLERRGRCERSLGRASDASKSLEEALGALSLATLPETRLNSLKSTISQLLVSCSPNKDESKEIGTSVAPPKSYGDNATIPCASDCIEMTYTKEMGRQMTATRDIYPGDVVIVEPPFAAAFIIDVKETEYNNANYTHCYTCMKRLLFLLPCKYCPLAMFCSETCRQTSWDMYHRYECPIIVMLQTLEFTGNIFLLLRILLFACNKNGGLVGLYEAIKAIENNPNKKQIKGFNKEGKYDSSDYIAVHNLLVHTEKRSSKQLFFLAIHAGILTRALDTFTDFFSQVNDCRPPKNGPPKDWKMFVGGVLLRYLQTMTTNSCCISDYVEGPGNANMRKIKFAHGLYPTSSMLNHSCNPNVLSHSRNGNVRAVMAVMSIKKGKQLFIAQSQSYITTELAERRSFLQEELFFTCKCEACVKHWPIPTLLDKAGPLIIPNASWRCSQCLSVLPPVTRSWKKSSDLFVHVCRHCQGRYENKKLKCELQDIAVQSHFVFRAIRGRTGQLGLPDDHRLQLANQLMRLERLVESPHPLIVTIQEHLYENFSVLGNVYKL